MSGHLSTNTPQSDGCVLRAGRGPVECCQSSLNGLCLTHAELDVLALGDLHDVGHGDGRLAEISRHVVEESVGSLAELLCGRLIHLVDGHLGPLASPELQWARLWL